jgi:hypothetical protein
MPLVNSREEQLSGQAVVYGALQRQDFAGYDPATALMAITKEMSLPDTRVIQFGNTIFITHVGKGDNKTKAVGRALNMDTGRNFVNNCLSFAKYLQERQITHYTTWFETDDYLGAAKLLQRVVKDTDTKVGIAEQEDGAGYILYIRIGTEPIPEAI